MRVYIEIDSQFCFIMKKLRVVTLFSGYDSQCLALERLKKSHSDFDYELIAWSEFDPMSKQPIEKQPAVIAHNALFPQWADRNLGDVSKIDWSKVEDFDFMTYSSPCQDFSNAGLQKGGEEGSGTRSSLLWECKRAIEAKRPRILVFENVKSLVGKKFMPLFQSWCDTLTEYGYTNFWKVLNAKDYGVPQNRERVIMVSILNPDRMYHFPKPFEANLVLNDVLEDKVEEKYYLSKKIVDGFLEHNKNHHKKGTGFLWKPTDKNGYAKCLRANPALCPTDNTIEDESNSNREHSEAKE